MEIASGFVIMLILLGFLFAAIVLSLPILVWGLRSRLEATLLTLEQLDKRITDLEQLVTDQRTPAAQPAGLFDTLPGGVDGIAGR